MIPASTARVVVTPNGTTRVITSFAEPHTPLEIFARVASDLVSNASTPHIEAPPAAATDTLSSGEPRRRSRARRRRGCDSRRRSVRRPSASLPCAGCSRGRFLLDDARRDRASRRFVGLVREPFRSPPSVARDYSQ
jgi:hypothetical protein